MTSNKNTRILHNINCDELVLDTNNDAKNLHFNIRTIGPVGQNDVEFKTCNVKVNDGDFFTDVIKDLDGNEFVNLSGANHIIKDVSGNPIITIGDSSIDFHSATLNNLTLGSLDTGDINSLELPGQSLDDELNQIEIDIASKLTKNGQTPYKILTTSAAGTIQFSRDINLLDQITTNQTNIGNNTSSISSNTADITDISNSVATNTADITDISNSVATNTTNIALNTANVSTALSNISTLDNTTLKLDETQTISGYNFYDTSSELSVSSNRFHIYNNANDTRAYFTHSYAGNVTLTLPSSTGTLSLKSPVDTNTTNIATNTSNIATKLPLAGGTLTGGLTGTTLDMNGSQIGTVFMGSSASYNFQIDDAPLGGSTETFAINFDTAFTPDAYFIGTTTATDVRLGTNNSTRIQIASAGAITTYNSVTIQGATYRDFGSGDTDITGQLPSGSSAFGHIIEGRTSGHLVLGIRGNDNNDSVTIASYTSGSSYDTSVATFQADGKIGMGTQSPDYNLDVLADTIRFKGVNASTHNIILDRGDSYWSVFHSSHEWDTFNDTPNKYTQAATTTGQEMFLNYYSDGNVFCCNGGGTLKHTGISNVSDDRLKHNEVNITNALNILKQLNPQKYFKTSTPYEADNNFTVDSSGNYIDESGNIVKGKMEAGLIAQEVMGTDLAWIVGGGGIVEKTDLSGNIVEVDEMYYVNYDSLHAYTIKAIQELETENSSLKSKVEVLESKLRDEEIKTQFFEMKINLILSHLNL